MPKKFLREYLEAKSKYHGVRVKYIYDISKDWGYYSEISDINKAKSFESAQEEAYRSANEKVLNIETLVII